MSVISILYTPVNIPVPAQTVPLTITISSPIPYSSEKAIPWNYGSDVYYRGVKQEDPLPKVEAICDEILNVENFAGVERITRSGRVHASPKVPRSADELAKAKGKQVQVEGQSSESTDVPREDAVSQEVKELLRIIKKSD